MPGRVANGVSSFRSLGNPFTLSRHGGTGSGGFYFRFSGFLFVGIKVSKILLVKKHGGRRPGQGRPPAGRESYCVRLRPKVMAWIDRQAFKNTCSRGEIIEECARQLGGIEE